MKAWMAVQVMKARWARRHFAERAWLWASRALPRELAYWAFIRVYAHATTGKYGNTHPDKIGYGKVARRWHKPNGCKRT